MVWSSAVSLALLISGPQVVPQRAMNDWARGVAELGPSSAPTGTAVQISVEGYFLAHASAAPTTTLPGSFADGRQRTMRLVARDDVTQLILLKAEGWPRGLGRAVRVATSGNLGSQRLLAVLPGGVTAGDLVSRTRPGILQPSRRYVRLMEIRFETPRERMGSAPVFTLDGQLVGILNATLEPVTSAAEESARRNMASENHFGPRGVTVGYALGPEVVKRVAHGFLRPDRTPQHPQIGVLYRSEESGGVVLTEVWGDSPAAAAGLIRDDRLVTFNGDTLSDAIDFAARLFDTEVGQRVTFGVQREGRLREFVVRIGGPTPQPPIRIPLN